MHQYHSRFSRISTAEKGESHKRQVTTAEVSGAGLEALQVWGRLGLLYLIKVGSVIQTADGRNVWRHR